MKKLLFFFLSLSLLAVVRGQENLNYQRPSQEILELAEAAPAPSVRITDSGEHMLLLQRSAYSSMETLSQGELRLAGLRIDPKTNIGSRTYYYNNITVHKIGDGKKGADTGTQVKGLPQNPRLANFNWSPDQSKIAFTHTAADGVEVYVLDLGTAQAKPLTPARVNANLGDVINWFKDGQSLLVKMLPGDRKPLIDADQAVPTGPTISTNDGKKAQNRTYQDLLKNPADEFNFEQLARSQLFKVGLDGSMALWKDTDMYTTISFS